MEGKNPVSSIIHRPESFKNVNLTKERWRKKKKRKACTASRNSSKSPHTGGQTGANTQWQLQQVFVFSEKMMLDENEAISYHGDVKAGEERGGGWSKH